jgi:uncharacterized membrane protein
MLLANTCLYYSSGMLILHELNGGMYQGIFTACIAVFNFVFAFTLYKTKKADLNLIYLLIGLVLTFISLAAPVQLKGNHITLFWAAETVLLLWLSQKSGIHLIKLSSLAVMGLMWISLVMDWSHIYSSSEGLTIIFNKGFITSLVALVSLVLSLLLLKNEPEKMLAYLETILYRTVLTLALGIFLYLSLLLELIFQLKSHVDPESYRAIIVGSYNLAFILAILLIAGKKENKLFRMASIALGIIGILAFVVYYHRETIALRDAYLIHHQASFWNFSYHYLNTALIVVLVLLCLKNMIAVYGIKSMPSKVFFWFLAFSLVFTASTELDHAVLLAIHPEAHSIEQVLSQNHKIGFAILWGLCAFVFITIGMRKKIKEFRIIALSLFSILLLKLFILDLRGISEGGKIAAFICLGILLLIISFMYQKLKKLVLEDEAKATQL